MGQRFGDWEVLDEIDQGGQGWIYKVRNSSGIVGALKRLKNVTRQPRFRRELEALKRVSHERVVQVLDADTEASKPFIVLAYVEGRSLAAFSPEELERVPLQVRLTWFDQVCSAIAAAHDQEVIHRDLKPDNILIGVDGNASVCDFGLAFIDEEQRLTETLEQVGSRFYISPECEEGRSDVVGKGTDLYSLGKVLYYLLSAGRVFPRELHRTPKYDLVKVNSDSSFERFSRILDSVLVHDPAKRLEDIRIMAQQVRNAADAHEGGSPVAGVVETYRCVFCRVGTYKVMPAGRTSAQNLGYGAEGNVGDEKLVYLECENCGNSQRFKTKYDRSGWFRTT